MVANGDTITGQDLAFVLALKHTVSDKIASKQRVVGSNPAWDATHRYLLPAVRVLLFRCAAIFAFGSKVSGAGARPN